MTLNPNTRNNEMDVAKLIKRGVAFLVAGIIGLILIFGSWYTVDQSSRGVILRNGALVGIAEPGLGFKIPMIDRVVNILVQDQAQVYENVLVYSNDQQTAALRVSVSYQVPQSDVARVYSDFGSVENMVTRLLDRQVPKTMEEVFGQYNAVTAIQERVRLGADVQKAIQASVAGSPILIKSVQVENIDFSNAYEQSIEDRMKAEVGVKTAQQNAQKAQVDAERDAKVKVINAQAEATAKVTAAEADAKAVQLRGEAEASAIKAKSAALASNPALIALTQAEKWDGKLPMTMVPGGAVPFLNVTP